MSERGFSKIEFGAENPVTIVYGMGSFLAKHVCEELVRKGLNVLGVGEVDEKSISFLENEKQFRHVNYLVDSWAEKIDPAYVFDLEGSEELWKWVEKWGSRIVILQDWKDNEEGYKKRDMDWRVVKTGMVYGPGMMFSDSGWLGKVFQEAVGNERMIFPGKKTDEWPVLYVNDLVELLMGACFFPNVSKEVLEVGGREVELGKFAKVLEDVGKTTKGMGFEGGVLPWSVAKEKMGIEERVSWEAETEIEEGVRLTMQDFFQRKEKGENLGKTTRVEEKKVEIKEEEPIEEEKIEKKRYQTVEVLGSEKEEGESETKEKFEETVAVTPLKEEVKEVEEEIDWLKRVEEKIEREVEEKMEIEKEEIAAPVEKKKEFGISEQEEVVRFFAEEKKGLGFGKRVKKEKQKVEKVGKKRGWGKWLTIVLLVGFLSLISGPIFMIVDGYLVFKDLSKVKSLVVSKNWGLAEEVLVTSKKRVERMEGKIGRWGVRDWLWGRRFSDLVVLEREVLEVGEIGLELVKTGDTFSQGVFQAEVVDWEGEFLRLGENLEELEEGLSMVQARMIGDWGWLPGKWRGEPRKWGERIGEGKDKISYLRESLPVWEYVLGVGGEKREFLVLLQNEMEIRPTGGFIGSVGFLSFQDGQFLDFSIKDVYSLDGQLKGHVDPPEELEKYLGEPGWYLRDANWDPDFSKSVTDINWFLEKETGKKVDGVIGMNLAVAEKIVGVVEKVYIPDYEEEITVENLYEQAELYSENKFFPGSSQKATFLGMLGKVLLEEVRLLGPDGYLKLGEALLGSLEEGELMISFNKGEGVEESRRILSDTGWDGQLQKVSCSKSGCGVNYLHINEANVGVNKANYFLKRGVEQVVDLRVDGFSSVVKINYENTARTSAWPAGDYKAYVRVYVPRKSKVDWVKIGGEGEEGLKISGDDLSEKTVGDKKELGFLLKVPVSEKRKVEVKYSLDFSKAGESLSFIYYLQKQAGWGNRTPFSLVISVPEGWNPLQVYPEATIVSGKLLYSDQIEKDLKIGVELGK